MVTRQTEQILPDIRNEYLELQNQCRNCVKSDYCGIRYFLKELELEDGISLIVSECRKKEEKIDD